MPRPTKPATGEEQLCADEHYKRDHRPEAEQPQAMHQMVAAAGPNALAAPMLAQRHERDLEQWDCQEERWHRETARRADGRLHLDGEHGDEETEEQRAILVQAHRRRREAVGEEAQAGPANGDSHDRERALVAEGAEREHAHQHRDGYRWRETVGGVEPSERKAEHDDADDGPGDVEGGDATPFEPDTGRSRCDRCGAERAQSSTTWGALSTNAAPRVRGRPRRRRPRRDALVLREETTNRKGCHRR
jgi:hypothetical protein